MQFNFNVNEVLKNSIEIIDCHSKLDFYNYNINGITAKNLRTPQKLSYIIDAMGNSSKLAQNLPKVITTASKLKESDHRLYLSKDELSNNGNGEIVGLLKVGFKNLFVYDIQGRQHETKPLCVLDFYIHESKQRQGFGRSIFEYMLKSENVEPHSLAIDRPSSKFLSFLAKHYQLTEPVPQSNNFVVFSRFFPALPNARPQSMSRRLQKTSVGALAAAGATPVAVTTAPVSAAAVTSQRYSARPHARDPVRHSDCPSQSPGHARHGAGKSPVKLTINQHPDPPLLPRGDNPLQQRWYLTPLMGAGHGVPTNEKALPNIAQRPTPPSALPINSMVTCQSAARSTPSLACETRQPIRMDRNLGKRDVCDYNYLVGLARNYSHTRIW